MALWSIVVLIKAHKKAGLFLALLVLLAFLSLFFFSGSSEKGGGAETYAGPQIFPERRAVSLGLLDQDNDGLKDWEETIYHTGPLNSDTDGDGINDGDEINARRDPLKPGPDDNIAMPPKIKDSVTKVPDENITENLTGSFARSYLERGGGTVPLDPGELSKKVLSEFSGSGLIDITFPKIKPGELKISQENSPQSIKNYLNRLAEIIELRIVPLPNPVLLFASILEKESFADQLYRFDPLISGYSLALAEIKKTEAPQSWKAYHEKILNLLLKLLTIVAAFRGADEDPIKAMFLAQHYQQAETASRNLAKEAAEEIKNLGIDFQGKEPAKRIFGL